MQKSQIIGVTASMVLVAALAGAGIAGAASIQERRDAIAAAAEERAAERELVEAAYAEKYEAATPSNLTKTPPPPPVAEAPPVDAPPAPQPEPEPEPDYGIPVPWIADPNPNNTEGGYWDTSACPSGAAYQAPDGNQYCT